MNVTSISFRALWLGLAAFAIACGGGSDPPPSNPPPPSGSDATPIRGNERLGWTQGAPTLQDVRAHTFVLFIDNARNSLLDVQCNDSGGTFSCSGRFPPMTPGRHALQLAAIWNGQEGPRSATLNVQMMSSEAPATSMAPGVATLFDGLVTCMRGPADCYDVQTVAAGVDGITWPVATGDGRLLFVENERFVRVVQDGVLQSEPALALDDSAERIVGLAVDARFDTTHAVFVNVTADDGRGARALRIVRYREVQNALGEPATIVDRIHVPDGAAVPIAIDGDGFVYVAIPGDTATANVAEHTYAGMLLRFTSDGGVPRDQASATPVLTRGFERPSALTIDPVSGRVWLAGKSQSSDSNLAMLVPPAQGAAWPSSPETIRPPDLDPAATPFVTFARSQSSEPALHVIATPDVFEVSTADRGAAAVASPLKTAGIARPLAIADGPNRERFLVAGSLVDHRATLLRLLPR